MRRPGPRTSRWAVAVIMAFAAVACGVVLSVRGASAGAEPSSVLVAAQTASSTVSNDERTAKFTACMRSHGVPDFPGITISADGETQLKGGVNPLSATYQAAAKACASLLPAGSALPADPEPAPPTTPTLGITCEGDCPKPPKSPEPPS